ncbi:TonB-dependent receptor domain-containing protein [Thiomicrorhabdus sp. Kp2]|uniref:TonB-dependent receptor domain-containing protein n=1 Tax=Thiomicrorhabdus sp. Kp2 TaxID=1123518 RepID=UPI000418F51F|nr:TonB-dependent receptor [Thiomicrorhabdus sp. Kp2]
MFTRKKIHIAILSACLVPTYTLATDLAPVEVTATKDTAQQITTDATTLLNSGNSETGTTLRQISGVDASRMGGHGVDLVIRGQSASQLNVLIDGAKIEGGCPNRMDPPTAYAEMSSFDEVTVVKGVNSVTYGSGGTGGTVLFERKAPTFEEGKPYNGEINIGGTNNGVTKDMNATISAGGDKGYIVLQGSKKSADNYTDGNGNEVESSYESQQGHIDLGWTPNENHELRLSYENTLVEDALFAGASMDSPKSDGTTTSLRYKGANISENIQNIEVDIYSSDVDHEMDNYTLRENTPGMKSLNITNVKTQGAKIQLTSMVGHTQLDYGIQFEGVDKISTLSNAASGQSMWYMWPDVKSETKSIFAESTSFFRDNQKVILGLRYDAYNADANAADLDGHSGGGTTNIASELYNATYSNNSTDTNTEQGNLNGLLRYERTLENEINLFAGLSRTHRYADATELFIAKGGTKNGNDISWVGNPDLNPEQHNQLDIGISQKSSSSNWSVSAYYDVVNDYILKDLGKNQTAYLKAHSGGVDNRTVYLNKDATIVGLEMSGNMKATQNITLGGNASLANGTNETDNRNLSNIAPLSGSVYAQYAGSNWDAGSRFNFATNQDSVNTDFNELETAGWSTLDLFGNYKINKNIKLSAGVDNLFDHAYYTYFNRTDATTGATYKVYEPGRVVWAKLNAKF